MSPCQRGCFALSFPLPFGSSHGVRGALRAVPAPQVPSRPLLAPFCAHSLAWARGVVSVHTWWRRGATCELHPQTTAVLR